jgi:hypothetical protein
MPFRHQTGGDQNDQDWMNVSKSLLIVSACVVGIPWGIGT